MHFLAIDFGLGLGVTVPLPASARAPGPCFKLPGTSMSHRVVVGRNILVAAWPHRSYLAASGTAPLHSEEPRGRARYHRAWRPCYVGTRHRVGDAQDHRGDATGEKSLTLKLHAVPRPLRPPARSVPFQDSGSLCTMPVPNIAYQARRQIGVPGRVQGGSGWQHHMLCQYRTLHSVRIAELTSGTAVKSLLSLQLLVAAQPRSVVGIASRLRRLYQYRTAHNEYLGYVSTGHRVTSA
eukprot:2284709-Rhodomonas_salina.6